MSFKILARTILHLGSELISSDGVAFYELIKNAFDAGSPNVNISIKTVIKHQDYRNFVDEINALLDDVNHGIINNSQIDLALEEQKAKIAKSIYNNSKRAKKKIKRIERTRTLEKLRDEIDMLNVISVADAGHGMSLDELDSVYLTIGTRSRYEQRNKSGSQIILGEKGIGRLAAMRLGHKLKVKTTAKGDSNWNMLKIDWRAFSHESDEKLQDIPIEPFVGKKKDAPIIQGTTITIGALSSAWSQDTLSEIAKSDFSKLADPFHSKKNFPIKILYNNSKILIPKFDSFLFNEAHAKATATFSCLDTPIFKGEIEYRGKKTTFKLEGLHLLSTVGELDAGALNKLGPFSVELYWFNRKSLKPFGDLSVTKLRELIANWAGGLMVYRDGFRVNPYGNIDDDWLDQDKKALASGGYKLNRRQTIGKVEISSNENPLLIDQSNREGIRQCPEFDTLKSLLQHFLQIELRGFMNLINKEGTSANPVEFSDIPVQIDSHKEVIGNNLKLLSVEFPKIKRTPYIRTIKNEIEKLDETIQRAKTTVDEIKNGHEKMLFLAGLGLMVDVLAHELNRATGNTLKTLRKIDINKPSEGTEGLFLTLEAQLKTLQKRLQSLDPFGTATRQRKETFKLMELVEYTVDAHEGQLKRHAIDIETVCDSTSKTHKLKAVKGMVIQILENLYSNSIYWLKMRSKIDDDFEPNIEIELNAKDDKLFFTDNGPGIPPQNCNKIFEAFHSTKPPKDGKGLGLYISKQLAEYNGYQLYLLEEYTINDDSYNTFVLDFNEVEQ